MMSKSEHITLLFIGGLFYVFKGDKQLADLCFNTAVDILNNYPFKHVGQA